MVVVYHISLLAVNYLLGVFKITCWFFSALLVGFNLPKSAGFSLPLAVGFFQHCLLDVFNTACWIFHMSLTKVCSGRLLNSNNKGVNKEGI